MRLEEVSGVLQKRVTLCRAGNRVLTIHMQDWAGNNRNARYGHFQVMPQENRYQMFASLYSGSLPDDFSYSSGMTFQVRESA